MTTDRAVDAGQEPLDAAPADGRSAVAIVTSLWEKVETLVQLEIRLGIAEAAEKLDELKRELAAKALAGAITFAGLLTLVAGVVALLAMLMNVWLAALVTGAVLSAAGIMLLLRPITTQSPAGAKHAAATKLLDNSTNEETRHGTV